VESKEKKERKKERIVGVRGSRICDSKKEEFNNALDKRKNEEEKEDQKINKKKGTQEDKEEKSGEKREKIRNKRNERNHFGRRKKAEWA